MGKVIKKKLNGMNWWMKTSLVLLLTLATSVYSVLSATAATYHVRGLPTVSVGTNGSTNVISEAGVTYNYTGTTNSWRAITNNTAPTGTSRNRLRYGPDFTGTYEVLRAYTPAYGSAMQISANATTNIAIYNGGTSGTNTAYAEIYEYNNTTGVVGARKGVTPTSANFNTTGVNLSLTFNNPQFTVAAGNRVVVFYYVTANATDPRLLFGAIFNSGTPAGTTYYTLTETVVPSDSTPPTAGTVTVSPDISGTYTSAAPTITTQFTDAQSAVTSCQYTTNGGTNWIAGVVSGASSPYTCTANPTGLTGSLNINMRATSTGGTGTATQITRTVDATVPTDGTLTATAGNAQVALSWTAATDTGGTGIASYILRYATGATAPASCAVGTAVTGSPFSSATLSVTHTGLVNGTQYSYRLCATDNIGNTSGGVTKSATPAAGPVTTITSCAGCHNYSPTFNDGSARNTPAGQFQGSHNLHVTTNSMACSACHTAPATTTSSDYGHANGTVNMATISGGTYSKGSFAVANTFTAGTCNTTTCHGATSPSWGTNSTGVATCVKCHGVSGTTTAAYSTTPNTAAPGYNATGKDTGGATAATDAQVGAHDTHLRALNAISSPIACNECHTVPATSGAAGHNDTATPAEITFGTLAKSGTGTLPTYTSGTGTCSNTYCHYGRDTSYAPPATTTANVVWNNTAYLSGTKTPAADCGKCHASPPLSTGTHAGVTLISACNGCHSHVNTDGTFNNAALHINGIVEASGECISCHAAIVNSPIAAAINASVSTRPDIVTPFSLASNHKRSGGNTVTNEDCTVCHMEGDLGVPNATYHKNGYIELRDPDLGATIKGVTHNGTTSAAGVWSSTATDARPVRFSRNLGSATIEADTAAIMVNFCLKCHDSAGAASTTARVTGGTALKPFNTTVAANPSGGVLNVAAQFATTNRSFHPVLARQNSGYTNTSGTKMVAPWNGVTKTATTTTYGPLITCWDCHAPVSATGTLTTSGIHGGAINGTDAVPLRGRVYFNGTTAATNLCVTCHVVSSGTTNHGTGSAMTSGTDGGMTYFKNRCYFCHASDVTRTRPWGAGDAHGFSTRGGTVGNNKAFPAASNGYAFIRSEGWYGNSYQQNIRRVGATTYTPTCNGRGTAGGGAGSCSRSSMGGYTPGGVY